MRPSIAVVMGTRPEVIKMAPIIERLRAGGWCTVTPVASGQHDDLFRQALDDYGLGGVEVPAPLPRTNDPAHLVDMLVSRLQPRIADLAPQLVLVQGDTATALAGARAAKRIGIDVAHVEAGLRTYDLAHPYPEELHRQEIARLARLHFAPTLVAARNLNNEGVAPGRVFVTGNTIVDSVRRATATSLPSLESGRIALVTLHRRELAHHLDDVIEGLKMVLARHHDLRMIIPAHSNPAISAPLRAALSGHAQVDIVSPLPHAAFLGLLSRASVVITDSGGVQEEATILGIPLVIVRRVTERPEVLTERAAIAGFDPVTIQRETSWALGLAADSRYGGQLGDGRAAHLIEDNLREFLRAPASRRGSQDRKWAGLGLAD